MTIYWNRSNQTKKTCLKLPNLLEWAVIFLTHIAQNQMPIMYKSSVKLMTLSIQIYLIFFKISTNCDLSVFKPNAIYNLKIMSKFSTFLRMTIFS